MWILFQETMPTEPNLHKEKNTTVTIDLQPPVPNAPRSQMNPIELDRNKIIKNKKSKSEQKQSPIPANHILKEKPKPKVMYTFDDDDKDLGNEARVETVRF